MKVFCFPVLVAVLIVTGCSSDIAPPSGSESAVQAIDLVPALGGLEFNKPVALVFSESVTGTGYIVEQSGRVLSVAPIDDEWEASEFLDIVDRVNDRGREEGLLGLALSPSFPSEPYIYVNYTAADPRRTVISRFTVSTSVPVVAEATSQKLILEVAQPYSNHNGGHLVFGPDGYLYIGFGDGGSAGDPRENGQDPGTLLGTILRIDVSDLDSTGTHAIPASNPFIGLEGARPEVWAFGLRNPWRFTFDRETGNLWVADVGQNEREEVNVVRPGLNYGWNIMEGSLCYKRRDQNCIREDLELPVTEYGREGGCSITGGYVYRGERVPSLYGSYVFGDFCSGKIWSYNRETDQSTELLDTDLDISSFAEDPKGELYVVSLDGGVYALVEHQETQ